VRCEVLDEQVGEIIESIKLDPSWERRMAGIVDTLDQRAQVEAERQTLEQRLRRLAKAYVDGYVDEEDYEFQQRVLKSQLDSLVIPEERSTLQAGQLLENLPLLWSKANLEERHTILNGFLDCVYVDITKPARLVGIRPKPQFVELLKFADSGLGLGVERKNKNSEPENASETDLTGWWRRGRLYLPQLQTSPVIIPHRVPRSWGAYTVAWAA
jgi:site-specific DNA recombinase